MHHAVYWMGRSVSAHLHVSPLCVVCFELLCAYEQVVTGRDHRHQAPLQAGHRQKEAEQDQAREQSA